MCFKAWKITSEEALRVLYRTGGVCGLTGNKSSQLQVCLLKFSAPVFKSGGIIICLNGAWSLLSLIFVSLPAMAIHQRHPSPFPLPYDSHPFLFSDECHLQMMEPLDAQCTSKGFGTDIWNTILCIIVHYLILAWIGAERRRAALSGKRQCCLYVHLNCSPPPKNCCICIVPKCGLSIFCNSTESAQTSKIWMKHRCCKNLWIFYFQLLSYLLYL